MCVIVKRNHRLRFEYQTFYSGKINYQPLTDDQNLYFLARLYKNKCAALVLIQLHLLSHRHHFLISYMKPGII